MGAESEKCVPPFGRESAVEASESESRISLRVSEHS
jgi:hypothetical protein